MLPFKNFPPAMLQIISVCDLVMVYLNTLYLNMYFYTYVFTHFQASECSSSGDEHFRGGGRKGTTLKTFLSVDIAF